MNYREKYNFWLENEYFDQQAKEELRALDGDKEEIKDRFYKDLCLLYTSPSPRDRQKSRMPSSA